MSENPNLLRSEIKGTSDRGLLAGGHFESRITALGAIYPIEETQNFHMFSKIIQELNRKLDQYGLYSNIIEDTDAGFRPLNLSSFFGETVSVNYPDFLQLQSNEFLLQQDGFRLILEQDV
tara:strand:+ start:6703 stop:7062 length:360 start_codon:yes stop_codon:yes gene_type:complete